MFHTILCPTDFSEASYKGLKVAAELALQNNAELCVLYVEAPLPELTSPPSSLAERCAEAVTNICAVIEQRVPVGVHSHPVLKRGEVIQEIQRVADQENADLIVLTAHGAGSAQHGGLGKVARAILSTASCPVLTISAEK